MNPRRVIAAPISAVAAHEAAHAVVSEHLGWSIERVTIVPDGDTNGAAHFAQPLPPWECGYEFDWLVRRATIYAAGQAGERLFGHLGRFMTYPGQRDNDEVELIARLLAFDEMECDSLVSWFVDRAAAIVDRLAPEIATVAKALDERKTLDRDDLMALLPSLAHGRMSPVGMRAFHIPEAAEDR